MSPSLRRFAQASSVAGPSPARRRLCPSSSRFAPRPSPLAAAGEAAAIIEASLSMHFLEKLNPEQREAVLHVNGPLLILAGAGSGKTRVITFRIAYLIGDGHAEPGEVLAVTFTNKAAGEMRERVESVLGAECNGVWLSTFHALCARLLRREAPHIGLSRDFTIYDSADQQSVIKLLMKEYGFDE